MRISGTGQKVPPVGLEQTPRRTLPLMIALAWAQCAPAMAAVPLSTALHLHGAATCSSAMCHGGADDGSRQFVVWSLRDVHSRAYATLGTARAARMAEALHIKNPATDRRCTSCHAPFNAVERELLAPDARVSEGVSCVTCHGPADPWLRSHTRRDFTHAERVAVGMRDLRDLRLRANACVACHQNIEPELIRVGRHPALIFELDGQAQAQPKHWREAAGFNGAQAWFVGQAVAWREISWALRHGAADLAREGPRWQALRWLLQRAGLDYGLPAFHAVPDDNFTAEGLAIAGDLADDLAKNAAQAWSHEQTMAVLVRLAATAGDFQSADVPKIRLASCAERLVLALDRLLAALPAEQRTDAASAQLDRLFALADSTDDFSPADFGRELAVFARAIDVAQSR